MKFAYSNLSCKGVSEGCVTASFFFNARGEYLERSISGMYRSLLLQLLQGYPNLQKVFDDIDLIPHSQTGCPSLNILKELFRSAVLSLGQSHFTCFIDALDECDEQEVVDMVQSFEELAEQATAKKIPLRICFSSRHYPYIVVKQGIRLTLEDQSGHAEDLATYAASRLQIEDPALIDELKPQILKKSAGVFIWVVFVIEILNKEYRRGGLALRKRLAEIPSDLGELFKDILRRDNENMEALQLCIFHILYAKRPLQPKEFYHALWSGLALENLVDEQIPDVTVSDTGAGPDRYTRYVISSSKGLAEITRSKQPTVQFIHESVRDFLIKDKGLYELWPELGFDCESYGHEKLKHCCNHYINHALGHPDVFPNEELSDSLHDRVEKMPGTKYPFLKYATHHILYHADIAAKQVAQDKFLSHFPTYDWIRLNNSFERLEIHEYSPTTRLISVLADKGFSELLRIRILADNGADVNASSNYGYTPLLFASANGHEAVARLLIENGADVNTRDITRCTPLFNASRNGHEAVVMLLIDNDADVNVYDNIGYTPLMYASIHGHTAVVRLLIDNGADAQATDKFGYAPLMYASRNGHEATARLLIDKGAAVNVNDSMGNTPLIFASMNGHDAVVRLLVKRGAAVNVNDSMGNTPLIFASMNGRETVVRLLLDNGANVHAHNLDKCTSLSYAKKNYHGNVEKLLIQMGAESTGASGSGRGKATSGS
jgi:ankyrin repeat protein